MIPSMMRTARPSKALHTNVELRRDGEQQVAPSFSSSSSVSLCLSVATKFSTGVSEVDFNLFMLEKLSWNPLYLFHLQKTLSPSTQKYMMLEKENEVSSQSFLFGEYTKSNFNYSENECKQCLITCN